MYREKKIHPEKNGVWFAISHKRIVGPLFFDSTINSSSYQDTTMRFVSLLELSERWRWFQQDGAIAHTYASTMSFLKEFSGDRVISSGLPEVRTYHLRTIFYGAI